MAGPTDDVFNIGINVRTTGEAGVKALGNIVSELIEKGSNVALNLNFGNSFAKANELNTLLEKTTQLAKQAFNSQQLNEYTAQLGKMKGEYLGIVGAIDKAQKSLSSLNPSADAARSLASLRGELGAYTRQQNEAQNKYNQLLEEGYKKNTKIVIQQKALLDNLKAENEVRRENIRLQEKAVEMSEKARVSAANQAQYYQDFDRSNNAGRYDNAARQQSEDRIRQQERAAQRRQQQADQMYAELQQRFQAMGAQTQGYRVNPSGTARSPVESYAAQSPGFEQYYPGATGYFENKKQAESRMRKARQAAASADAKFVADLDADIRAKAEFAGSVYVQLGAHAPLASFAGTAELQAQLNRHRLAFLESIENDLRDADKIYQEGRLNSKIRAAKDFTGGTQTEGTIKESIAQREAAIAGYNRRINTTSRDNSPEGQRELERLYKERTAQERLLQNDREILPKQASADAARKESEQASSRAFDAGVSRSGSRTAQALDLLQNRGLSPTPSGRRGITFGSSFGAQGRKIFDSEGGEFLEPQSLPPAAGVQFSLSEIQSGNLLLQRNELEVEKTRLRRFDQLRSFRGLTKPTEVIEQIKKQVSGIVDRKKLLAEAEENFFRAAGDPEAQKRIETEAQKIGDEIDGLRKALQDGANKVKSLKTSGRKGDERARLPQAVRLAKAQKEIFFLSPEQREDEEGSIKEIAERFRLNETLKDRQGNDIAGAGQAADRLRRGRFFEAARLANPESLVQLGFAGAFGGIPSLIGGAIGGASPLGPSGALLGSTLSQAVGQILFEKPIEAIKSVAEEIKESGLSLQRSILGITAIRQENVEVLGAGGKALGATQALDINQEKAREIQFAARAKLLPLGIGGQTEATFVQGVTSALSQRGLNANAQQTARIAELFGGAIQSQRPSLLENSQQLLKDLQDVLGGGPSASRTVLSQIVRPALPDIQKAGSAEELIKGLEKSLGGFVTAATQLDNPIVALNKLNGALDNLKTNAGDAYLAKLTPAIGRFFEVISAPEAVSAAVKLGEALGNFTAFLTDSNTALAKLAISLTDNFLKPLLDAIPTLADFAAAISAVVLAAKTSEALSTLPQVAKFLPAGKAAQAVEGAVVGEASKDFFSLTAATLAGGTGALKAAPAAEKAALEVEKVAVREAPLVVGLFEKLGAAIGPVLEGFASIALGLPGLIAALTLATGGLVAFAAVAGAQQEESIVNEGEAADKQRLNLILARGQRQLPSSVVTQALKKLNLEDSRKQEEQQEEQNPEFRLGVLDKALTDLRVRAIGGPGRLPDDKAKDELLRSEGFLERATATEERNTLTRDVGIKFDTSTPAGKYALAEANTEGIQKQIAATTLDRNNLQKRLEQDFTGDDAVKKFEENRKSQIKDISKIRQEDIQKQADIQKKIDEEGALQKTGRTRITETGGRFTLPLTETEQLASEAQIKKLKLEFQKQQDKVEEADKALQDLQTRTIADEQRKLKGEIEGASAKISESVNELYKSLDTSLSSIRDTATLRSGALNTSSAFGQKRAAQIQGQSLDDQILEIEKKKTGLKPDQVAILELQQEALKNQRYQNETTQSSTDVQQIRSEGVGIDTSTFSGQRSKLAIDLRAAELDVKNKNAELAKLAAETQGGKVGSDAQLTNFFTRKDLASSANLARIQKEKEIGITQPLSELKGIVEFEKSAQNLADVSVKLGDHFGELSESVVKSTRALEDFDRTENLRALGREGQRLAAGEKFVKAGGSVDQLPLDIARLINDPEERQKFELKTAKAEFEDVEARTDIFRTGDEDRENRRVLQRGLRGAQRELRNAPLNQESERLQAADSFIEQFQKIDENSPLRKLFQPQLEGVLKSIEPKFGAPKEQVGAFNTLQKSLGEKPKEQVDASNPLKRSLGEKPQLDPLVSVVKDKATDLKKVASGKVEVSPQVADATARAVEASTKPLIAGSSSSATPFGPIAGISSSATPFGPIVVTPGFGGPDTVGQDDASSTLLSKAKIDLEQFKEANKGRLQGGIDNLKNGTKPSFKINGIDAGTDALIDHLVEGGFPLGFGIGAAGSAVGAASVSQKGRESVSRVPQIGTGNTSAIELGSGSSSSVPGSIDAVTLSSNEPAKKLDASYKFLLPEKSPLESVSPFDYTAGGFNKLTGKREAVPYALASKAAALSRYKHRQAKDLGLEESSGLIPPPAPDYHDFALDNSVKESSKTGTPGQLAKKEEKKSMFDNENFIGKKAEEKTQTTEELLKGIKDELKKISENVGANGGVVLGLTQGLNNMFT